MKRHSNSSSSLNVALSGRTRFAANPEVETSFEKRERLGKSRSLLAIELSPSRPA